jgi:hypothetical protein
MRFSLGVLQMSSWCTCGADAVSAPLAAAGKEPLDEQAMGKKDYLSMMAQENQVPHGDAPVLPFLSSCTYYVTDRLSKTRTLQMPNTAEVL